MKDYVKNMYRHLFRDFTYVKIIKIIRYISNYNVKWVKTFLVLIKISFWKYTSLIE